MNGRRGTIGRLQKNGDAVGRAHTDRNGAVGPLPKPISRTTGQALRLHDTHAVDLLRQHEATGRRPNVGWLKSV